MALTEAQLAEFHDRGLVVVEDVLTDADLDPVIETMTEFVDRRARDLQAEGKIIDLYEDEPFLTRYARLFAQSAEIGRGMDIYDLRAEPVFDFLRNDNLLDA
ncbi:MAG: mitomycin antibiotic biosynthesis protein, partial [Gemmatimonadetes bacterium]|nr:mitomycin antibiotic biosynthesis protein [Gemmatimonadota bacterium]